LFELGQNIDLFIGNSLLFLFNDKSDLSPYIDFNRRISIKLHL